MPTIRRTGLFLLLVVLAVGTPQAAPGQEPAPGRVETVAVDAPITAWDRLGGVAVDSLGFVYTTAFAEEVWKIAPDGGVALLADGFYGASGNAVDINGDLLQAGFFSNTIHRISRTGVVSLVADDNLSGPVGIAVNAEGVMFVCSCIDNTLVRVERDGRAAKFSESELYSCPNGITFDDRGDLYMVNFNNDDLVKVDADGNAESVATIEPAGGWPQWALDVGVRGNAHLAFVNGNFYVTKFKSNTLWRVGRDDGSVEMVAGTYQYGLDDGPLLEATFASPNGIAAFRGDLFLNNTTGPERGPQVAGPAARIQRATLVLRRVVLPR